MYTAIPRTRWYSWSDCKYRTCTARYGWGTYTRPLTELSCILLQKVNLKCKFVLFRQFCESWERFVLLKRIFFRMKLKFVLGQDLGSDHSPTSTSTKDGRGGKMCWMFARPFTRERLQRHEDQGWYGGPLYKWCLLKGMSWWRLALFRDVTSRRRYLHTNDAQRGMGYNANSAGAQASGPACETYSALKLSTKYDNLDCLVTQKTSTTTTTIYLSQMTAWKIIVFWKSWKTKWSAAEGNLQKPTWVPPRFCLRVKTCESAVVDVKWRQFFIA